MTLRRKKKKLFVKLVGYVNDIEKLKQVFLQFMMPFYPYYYKQLSEGGLRHTALLQPNTLRLFQQLTGKKFRPGYRNRYTTGVRAFEWDKNRYKVYGKDGKLLCDAIFGTDGIIEGYGQKKYTVDGCIKGNDRRIERIQRRLFQWWNFTL